MKFFIYTSLLLLSLNLVSQNNCEFSTNVTDSIGTYKETKTYLVQERNFGGSSSYVFFSLVLANGVPSLHVQSIKKSNDFIKAHCLDKNSRLYFELENGKIVTLIHQDQENCGTSVRDEKNKNNRLLTGNFLFLKGSIADLNSAPISMLRIKYATENVDYIFKKEILSEMDGQKYFPAEYFLQFLKCVAN